MLPQDIAVPGTNDLVLFICTNGFFMQTHVLQGLLTVGRLECMYVPILAEENFRFPAKSFKDDHCNVAKSVSDDPEHLLTLAVDIFTEIAVVFEPEKYSSTEQILATKALEIYERCQGGQSSKTLPKRKDSKPEADLPIPDGESRARQILSL